MLAFCSTSVAPPIFAPITIRVIAIKNNTIIVIFFSINLFVDIFFILILIIGNVL